MTSSELRKIIRESIESKINEISLKVDAPPDNFSDFRWIFSKALDEAGAPRNIIAEAYENEHVDSELFETMHMSWTHIRNEMKNIHDPDERQNVWDIIKEFYIQDAVDSVLNNNIIY